MKRAILASAAALLCGCQSVPPGSGYVRADGQPMPPGSALEQQFATDRTVCLGEMNKADLSGTVIDTGNVFIDVSHQIERNQKTGVVMLGCMAQHGYRFELASAAGTVPAATADEPIPAPKTLAVGLFFAKVPPGSAEAMKIPSDQGMIVMRVVPGTPAARAKIEAGDIITSVGGNLTNDEPSLKAALAAGIEAKKAEVVVWRNGATKKITISF